MKDPGAASVVAGVFLRRNVFGRNYRWAVGKKLCMYETVLYRKNSVREKICDVH
mgnify:FL=1